MDNWDNFKFEVRYQLDKLQPHLGNIETHRLSINRLILPTEWAIELRKLHIVRAVHGTTAIEGNPMSQEEVARQLDSKAKGRFNDQVHRQTSNAERAFRWIEKHFVEHRSITLDDILHIHQLLTTGSDEGDNTPGRLRASGHNVTVGSPMLGGVHRAPPGGDVTRQLVDRFVVFVNSASFRAEPPVVQAVIAHFYFVTLHPFGNGNGRTTRCIEAAILLNNGYNTHSFYSLSNFFYRNRDDYFQLLQRTRTEYRYDLTSFLEFGARGFSEELDRINAYIRNRTHRLLYQELIQKCSEKMEGTRRKLLNDREVKLLRAILELSKPSDPFSDEPAKEATLQELSPVLGSLYANKTPRTMEREFFRLKKKGFIHFKRTDADDMSILINLEAIGRY